MYDCVVNSTGSKAWFDVRNDDPTSVLRMLYLMEQDVACPDDSESVSQLLVSVPVKRTPYRLECGDWFYRLT